MTGHIKTCCFLICLVPLLVWTHIAPAAADEGTDPEVAEAEDGSDLPPGYIIDEYGRPLKTSFDLRRRYHLGVYDMMRVYEDQGFGLNRHSLLVQVGGSHEIYDAEISRRHRHRFAEGRLSLAPFEIDALAYGYDSSVSQDNAPIWITTFIGEPRRFDVPIALGAGYSLGRLHYRRTELSDLMVLNFAEGHINWEFYQGPRLENYLLISTGVGFGLIQPQAGSHTDIYASPELGLRGAWTVTEDGRTQLGLQGRMQWAWDLQTGHHWQMGSLQASAEWTPMAINDQPLSIFLAPEIRYNQIPSADLQGLELRVILGARLSLFVPPRTTEEER